jgi:hypothetical protein
LDERVQGLFSCGAFTYGNERDDKNAFHALMMWRVITEGPPVFPRCYD